MLKVKDKMSLPEEAIEDKLHDAERGKNFFWRSFQKSREQKQKYIKGIITTKKLLYSHRNKRMEKIVKIFANYISDRLSRL